MQQSLPISNHAGQLRYCVGYTFGMHIGEQNEWAHAVVSTDRYMARCVRECTLPIIVDNGAFPAWRDGSPLDLNQQLDNIWSSVETAGDRVQRIIAPDVVGDSRATYARICGALHELARFRKQLLFPIQEGYWRTGIIELAAEVGAGLFIGGATKQFKRHAVARIRPSWRDMWIHVGRISKHAELAHAAHYDVDAFDTTTFARKQDRNMAIDWKPRFEKYVRRQQ